ncbi:MAG TPA: hypothetical protein VI758_11400 [Bacteroidota bacterium]
MSTGQTFMVIAAMMLLGTLSLSVNTTLINSSSTGLEMEAGLDALSYGQSLLDEILAREFDEKTLTYRAFNYSDLTPIALLGKDNGESIPQPDSSASDDFHSKRKFDDVDDYHNYVRINRNSRLDNFTETTAIEYVQEANPDALALSPTFYKRVTVTISNPYMVKDLNGNVFPLVLWDIAVYRKYF